MCSLTQIHQQTDLSYEKIDCANATLAQSLFAEDLKFHISLHRLFTFFTFSLPLIINYGIDFTMLAEQGLFLAVESARAYFCCHFCRFKIRFEDFTSYFANGPKIALEIIQKEQLKFKCKIRDANNVPMGNSSVLNLKFEAHRLFSLLKKRDWRHVEPLGLARSGFYYTGDEDNVRCAFCNLEVRGWEAGDTPDGEHGRWNPNCPLLCNSPDVINVKIGREQGEIGPDGINMGPNPFSPQANQLDKYGPNVHFVKTSSRHLLTSHDLNIQNFAPPFKKNFATLNSRVESFKRFWPKSPGQTPVEMARAGFYHTGEADRVVCFHCNLALKDWLANDDPYVQHCKWNPSCQYLSMCKGPGFANQVLLSAEKEAACAPARRADGDIRCLKCRRFSVSKVNLPCGHLTFCHNCSDGFCVSCQKEIISEVKVPGLFT